MFINFFLFKHIIC